MPAHSVKPAIMAELIDLEDERDNLVRQLNQLQKSNGKNA
jgi:flagellar hook-associated protein FlgK